MQENNCLKLPQMSNEHWCWKNEQHLNIDYNFDHQMSLSKIKCWYSNNCLNFFKGHCSITKVVTKNIRGRIFSCVRPFYEWALSNLDRSMHTSLLVWVAHILFIEGSHMNKNTTSGSKLLSASKRYDGSYDEF